jgi:hypothetical protein
MTIRIGSLVHPLASLPGDIAVEEAGVVLTDSLLLRVELLSGTILDSAGTEIQEPDRTLRMIWLGGPCRRTPGGNPNVIHRLRRDPEWPSFIKFVGVPTDQPTLTLAEYVDRWAQGRARSHS